MVIQEDDEIEHPMRSMNRERLSDIAMHKLQSMDGMGIGWRVRVVDVLPYDACLTSGEEIIGEGHPHGGLGEQLHQGITCVTQPGMPKVS